MKRKYIIGISLLVACLFAASAVSAAGNGAEAGDYDGKVTPILTPTIWSNGAEAGGQDGNALPILWSATLNVEKKGAWVILCEDPLSWDGAPLDPNDIGATPPPPSGVGASLSDHWSMGALAQDCRHYPDTDKQWNLTVTYNVGTGNPNLTQAFDLTWDSSEFAGSEYTYVNLTNASGFICDMLATTSHTFNITDPYPASGIPGNADFFIVCEDGVIPPEGDNCWYPYDLFDIPSDLDYSVSHTTTGMNDDYAPVGDDTVYLVDVTADSVVDIILDNVPTGTFLGLYDDCPDVGNLLASDTAAKGSCLIDDYTIAVGSYYLLVDGSPGTYDLTIHYCHDVGVTEINSPPDECYADTTYPVNVTVCNWGNDETSIPVHVTITNVTAAKGDTVLLSEGFEGYNSGFPPAGWSEVQWGNISWKRDDYSYEAPPNGVGFHALAKESYSGGIFDAALFTQSFDASGTICAVEFDQHFDDYGTSYDDEAMVLVASGGSILGYFFNWTLDDDSHVAFAFDPATMPVPSDVQIGWYLWDGGANYGEYTVDNVMIYDNNAPSTVYVNEDFDAPATGFPPAGWTMEVVSGTDTDNIWNVVDAGDHPVCTPHMGTYMAEYDVYIISSGNSNRLYTSAIDFSTYTEDDELTFWMYHDDDSDYYTDNVTIQVSTDGSSWTDLATFFTYNPVESWQQHTVDLSSLSGETTGYVGFLGMSDYGMNNVYMDDIEVTGTMGAGDDDDDDDVVVYDEIVYVDIDGGSKDCEYVDLPDWDHADVTPGDFTVEACTELPNDDNNGNNCTIKNIVVLSGQHDVGVVSIDEPSGNILEGFDNVEATVENFGDFDETDVLVDCKIYQVIPDGDDDDDDDDDMCSDFEADDGGWVATATWDPVGDWEWTNTYDVSNYVGTHTPPPTAASGTGLWGTVIYADYTNSGGESYLKQTFDFSGMTNVQLTFNSWIDAFGSWDYGRVMVNGVELARYDTYNPTAWTSEVLSLAAFDGNPSVEINFEFHASTVVEYYGWCIDDVCITGDLKMPVDAKDSDGAKESYLLVYADTELVDILEGAQETVVFIPPYDFGMGTYAINVTTMLSNDNHPENDSMNITVEVVVPNVYNVEKDWWYTTIQDAVDDADPGNTLQAKPLVFEENVVIPMSVTLMPYGSGMPILNGMGDTGFLITGDDVVINMFEITNCSNGVHLEGNLGTTIRNCTIHGNADAGIYMAGASDYSIVYNHIYDNGLGVSVNEATAPLSPPKSKDVILTEDFDGTWVTDSDGDLAPAGWEVDQYNSLQWWHQDTFDAHSGAYSAALFWDYDPQDEWIIAPSINLAGYMNTELIYWTYGYFGSTYSDHYYVKVSTDGGSTWTIEHDQTDDYPADQGWNYYASPITVDLSAYDGMSDVTVAFHADGIVSVGMWYYWLIDDVEINADTAGPTHTLDVTIVGDGTVIKDPDMTDYPQGSTVELTAVGDPGWTFDHWEGDLTGTSNPETITMDANKFVTAVFEIDLSGEGGIHYNYFGEVDECDTPGIAIQNFIGTRIIPDARWNWYDACDGPSGGTIDAVTGRPADGSGFSVFGELNFDPWAGVDAFATASETEVLIGDSITFDASESFACMFDGTLHDVVYYWSFGDGFYSFEEETGHIYDEAGIYNVYLRVSANDLELQGATMYDFAYMTITVSAPDMPLSANADANNFGGYEGTLDYPVEFYGAAMGGVPTYTYEWNFGDGTNTVIEKNPEHYYDEPGTYAVTLTVTDSEDNTATDSAIVTIYEADELVANAGGPYDGMESEDIFFSGSATGGESPYAYEWSFGDGTTAEGQYVHHIYDTDGTFTATLTVTDNIGNVDEHTTAVTVNKGESVEIRDVKGGFGIKATIKAGDVPVDWTITIDGKFVFGTESCSGTIDADSVETVKTPFVMGIGSVDITITAGSIAEEHTAYMIGPFVLAMK